MWIMKWLMYVNTNHEKTKPFNLLVNYTVCVSFLPTQPNPIGGQKTLLVSIKWKLNLSTQRDSVIKI